MVAFRFTNFFLILASGLLVLLAGLINLQVLIRNFFASSIIDYIQIAESLVVLLIILPLITAHSKHLKISFFFDKFNVTQKSKIEFFARLVALLLSSVLLIAAWQSFHYAWQFQTKLEGDLAISQWLPRLGFFVAILVFFSHSIFNFIKIWRKE